MDQRRGERRGPFTVLSSRETYRNPWLAVREDRVILPDESEGIFGVVTMIDGASVLPLDDEGHVFLVDEYKFALGARSLEVVSGGIEPGESPEQTARRELEEEAGLTAAELIPLGHLDPFTTAIASVNYMFLARGLGRSIARPDPAEQIVVRRMPLADAVRAAERSEITHAASVVLILKAAAMALR